MLGQGTPECWEENVAGRGGSGKGAWKGVCFILFLLFYPTMFFPNTGGLPLFLYRLLL